MPRAASFVCQFLFLVCCTGLFSATCSTASRVENRGPGALDTDQKLNENRADLRQNDEDVWGKLDVMKRDAAEALARTKRLFKDMEVLALSAAVMLLVGICFFMSCSKVEDFPRFPEVEATHEGQAAARQGQELEEGEEAKQLSTLNDKSLPLLVIIALTLYRFHTGFLGATWVPFFIAKEAEVLSPARQTLFMGEEKLIYGLSLCFNPLFGLLSDWLTAGTSAYGRATFLLGGVLVAGSGIYFAKVASDVVDVTWYLVASAVWMLGEAMADTTTEAVILDYVPPRQHDLASTVRSLQSFAGCLTGLVCLIIFRDVHHHWLYPAYTIMMLVCAFATAVPASLLPRRVPASCAPRSMSFTTAFHEAYVAPLQQSGNFFLACLATGLFSLGTAPIFFTLPLVRDLVGVQDKVAQQIHFSFASIIFLLNAVTSSVVLLYTGRTSDEVQSAEGKIEHERRRWTQIRLFTTAYGLAVLLYPVVGLGGSVNRNMVALYGVSSCIGLAYGAVYCRFQTCTWSIIPASANFANWMGMSALAKVMGCGFGNFAAGLILDKFRRDPSSEQVALPGYAVMSWFCTAFVLLSVCVISSLERRILSQGCRAP